MPGPNDNLPEMTVATEKHRAARDRNPMNGKFMKKFNKPKSKFKSRTIVPKGSRPTQ